LIGPRAKPQSRRTIRSQAQQKLRPGQRWGFWTGLRRPQRYACATLEWGSGVRSSGPWRERGPLATPAWSPRNSEFASQTLRTEREPLTSSRLRTTAHATGAQLPSQRQIQGLSVRTAPGPSAQTATRPYTTVCTSVQVVCRNDAICDAERIIQNRMRSGMRNRAFCLSPRTAESSSLTRLPRIIQGSRRRHCSRDVAHE
jgi:hypothetical protein